MAGEMEEMIWQAVHAGFGYFQREAGYTRTGSHHRRADGLWRTLQTAGLAGLNPADVLTTAISQRSLTGARDVASVIDARIRRRIAGMVPLPQPRGASASPMLSSRVTSST
jgi:hypothetical protein